MKALGLPWSCLVGTVVLLVFSVVGQSDFGACHFSLSRAPTRPTPVHQGHYEWRGTPAVVRSAAFTASDQGYHQRATNQYNYNAASLNRQHTSRYNVPTYETKPGAYEPVLAQPTANGRVHGYHVSSLNQNHGVRKHIRPSINNYARPTYAYKRKQNNFRELSNNVVTSAYHIRHNDAKMGRTQNRQIIPITHLINPKTVKKPSFQTKRAPTTQQRNWFIKSKSNTGTRKRWQSGTESRTATRNNAHSIRSNIPNKVHSVPKSYDYSRRHGNSRTTINNAAGTYSRGNIHKYNTVSYYNRVQPAQYQAARPYQPYAMYYDYDTMADMREMAMNQPHLQLPGIFNAPASIHAGTNAYPRGYIDPDTLSDMQDTMMDNMYMPGNRFGVATTHTYPQNTVSAGHWGNMIRHQQQYPRQQQPQQPWYNQHYRGYQPQVVKQRKYTLNGPHRISKRANSPRRYQIPRKSTSHVYSNNRNPRKNVIVLRAGYTTRTLLQTEGKTNYRIHSTARSLPHGRFYLTPRNPTTNVGSTNVAQKLLRNRVSINYHHPIKTRVRRRRQVYMNPPRDCRCMDTKDIWLYNEQGGDTVQYVPHRGGTCRPVQNINVVCACRTINYN